MSSSDNSIDFVSASISGCVKDVSGWVGSAAGGVAVGVRGEVVRLLLQTRTLRAGWDVKGQRTREEGELAERAGGDGRSSSDNSWFVSSNKGVWLRRSWLKLAVQLEVWLLGRVTLLTTARRVIYREGGREGGREGEGGRERGREGGRW